MPYPSPNRLNLVGETYGSLLVTGLCRIDTFKHTVWLCDCSCGRKIEAPARSLRRPIRPLLDCGCGTVRVVRKHCSPARIKLSFNGRDHIFIKSQLAGAFGVTEDKINLLRNKGILEEWLIGKVSKGVLVDA